MNTYALRRAFLLLISAAFAFGSLAFPFIADAGALTTTNQVSTSGSSCTGSYIQDLAALDTAYLPSNYATPGAYCMQTMSVTTFDCSGNPTGTGYVYSLFSGATITSNSGRQTNTCKGGLSVAPFKTNDLAAAYAAGPVSGKLAAGGSRTNTSYSTITYLAATASLSGGTTINSGGNAFLTWSSNLTSSSGSCTGTNFSTGGAVSGSISVSPGNTTTYTVTCTLNSGSSASASQTVIVIPPLSASTVSCSASPTSVSTGQGVTWTANVGGGVPPYSYSWWGDEGAFGQTAQSFGITYASSGTKSAGVQVTDSSGTPGYTALVTNEYDNEVCTGSYTGYSTPQDSAGYGPGIITNYYLSYPSEAMNYAPPGFASNPTGYCVQLTQYTQPCGGGGSCIPNPSWGFDWYAGNGVAYISHSSAYRYESWNWTTNTNSGTPNATASVSCSNTVSVSGTPCSSCNSCGSCNAGELVGGVCSVGAPANPAGYGSACTSSANSCGQTNPGTIQCNGSCSASTPANPAGYGTSCTSVANACSMTSTGTILCNGSCSAVTPPNSSCAPPTASLTATSPVTYGSNTTLTWGSTNAYTCTGTGFSTGGAVSGSLSVKPASSTTYSVTCMSSAGPTASQSASVTVNFPDLTAGSTSVSPNPPSVGSAASLSASISNTGSAAASSFPNMFQIASDAAFANTVALVNGSTLTLAPSGSSSSNASYTFAANGTYYVRACANYNSSWGGSIPEGNTGNNCGATATIVVSPPPADLQPTTGNANVTAPVNPLAGVAVTLSASFTNYGTAATSGSFPDLFEIYPGSVAPSTFSQITSSGGVASVTSASLAQSAGNTVSASYAFPSAGAYLVRACANTNSSNVNVVGESNYGNNCGTWAPVFAVAPTVILSANPPSILKGATTTLSWVSQNAVSCTGDNFPTPGNPTAGSNSSVSPQTTTTYSITCAGAGGSAATGVSTAQVTVVVANLSLSANPTVVRNGDPTYLTWVATGSDVVSCTVTGPGIPGGSYSGLSGTNQPATVTGSSTYTLSCNAGAYTPTKTVTVGLTPQFEEF